MTVVLDPAAPVAGAATTAHIRLRTPDGQPIPATGVRLEAHMTHPGMTPVLPVVVRVGDGDYTSRVEFSMAGDWTLVVTGELAGGRRFTRESRVAGVGPPR
jgi:hypothetical protein